MRSLLQSLGYQLWRPFWWLQFELYYQRTRFRFWVERRRQVSHDIAVLESYIDDLVEEIDELREQLIYMQEEIVTIWSAIGALRVESTLVRGFNEALQEV